MVKISETSYENDIYRVDGSFNEDSRNIIFFCQGGLKFGEGTVLGKISKNRETYCFAN